MAARRKRDRRRPELSQHFLRSSALASSLVSRAPIRPTDRIVEIGPGLGVLTAELAASCRSVVGVELDARLCGALRARFGDEERVSIVQGDFLRYRLPRDGAYKVFGNIPFHRTAAIVGRVTGASPPPEEAYLIVQREAAERFAGAPFANESLASLRLKPWWHIEIPRRLRRSDFEPPPAVDAVVLWLARRGRPLVEDRHAAAWLRFVDAGFGRGGNTVGRCLRASFTHPQLRRLARDLRFDPSHPPSRLSFEQWLGLFRFLLVDG